jgi:hypothetical protein
LAARGFDLGGAEPVKDDETAALLFGLARAQAATAERHQSEEVATTLRRPFEYYVEVGDTPGAVGIAQSQTLARLYAGSSEAAQILARSFVLVPTDSHEAGNLLTRYVAALGMQEADYSRAMEAFGQGLAIAQRAQDTAPEGGHDGPSRSSGPVSSASWPGSGEKSTRY